MSFSFVYPWLLVFAALPPLLTLAGFLVRRRQRRAAEALTGRRGARPGPGRRRDGGSLRLAALSLVIVGAAGPCWGRDPDAPPAVGRDLLIVLDVSRSMLAEDPPPHSRLARARVELHQLVDAVQRRGGHRLGLVAFAGQAKLLCPLTEDYDHFRHALALAHPNHFGPVERIAYAENGAGTGTSLRAALELAARSLDPQAQGFQDILLVSDGDDLAGEWPRGLLRCQEAGAAVHVLGVGDPGRDSFIPTGLPDEPFLLLDPLPPGEPRRATTRRHDDVLGAIAEQTRGKFLVEQPQAAVLVPWFRETITSQPPRERTEDQRPVPRHQFAWFFALAALLFGLDLFWSSRGPRPPRS